MKLSWNAKFYRLWNIIFMHLRKVYMFSPILPNKTRCPISFWLNHIFPYLHHFFPMVVVISADQTRHLIFTSKDRVANAKFNQSHSPNHQITKSPEIQKHQNFYINSNIANIYGGFTWFFTGNHLWMRAGCGSWLEPTKIYQGRAPGSWPGQSVPSALASFRGI